MTPLVEELSPPPDPWDAARRLAHRPLPIFLDSAGVGPPLGRYSFVAADPFAELRAWPADPLAELGRLLARYPAETVPGLPPFQGGAAGLFGYGLSRRLERLPAPRSDDLPTVDLAVGFYDWVLAFDHAQHRAWVVSTGFPVFDPAHRRARAEQRLAAVRRWITKPPRPWRPHRRTPADRLCPQFPLPGHPGVTSDFDRPGYVEAARRAVEYVHAGDCFQVNIAQRLLTPLDGSPLDLYGRLRERNPCPFGGYFAIDDGTVVASASPERFVQVSPAGDVSTRPIKGTRPRGTTPDADAAIASELLASAKDRAENVMIVDLLRNDLGRVCEYGSVRVESLCRLETYPTVHHLVSEVRGRLRRGATPIDLLKAAFPGGSVTGAPKVRAMEIIAELEPVARGPYCGSLGYVGFDGAADTSILIRTFTLARGWLQFPVGGGIVADSRPEQEYEETLHKAAGLLRAL
jgi:para-aminobenzoate synthetase component 1